MRQGKSTKKIFRCPLLQQSNRCRQSSGQPTTSEAAHSKVEGATASSDHVFVMGIDPGVQGGLAWCDTNGEIHACSMPETRKDLSMLLRTLNGQAGITFVEKVGFHVHGNSASSSVKFGRMVERIEMGLDCHDYRWDYVAPTTWMKFVLKAAPPTDHKERKNAVKAAMQRLYPTVNVTLKTADALGILTYALEESKKGRYRL